MKRGRRVYGATLVEVLVSITILVILVGVSGTMLVSGLNVFYKSAQLRAAQEESGAVYDLLANRMHAAQTCVISDEPTEIREHDTQLIVTENTVTLHRFWKGEEETVVLMDEDTFGEHTVRVYAERMEVDAIALTVEIYHTDGQLIYARSGAVPLMNHADTEILRSGENTAFTLTCTYQDSE